MSGFVWNIKWSNGIISVQRGILILVLGGVFVEMIERKKKKRRKLRVLGLQNYDWRQEIWINKWTRHVTIKEKIRNRVIFHFQMDDVCILKCPVKVYILNCFKRSELTFTYQFINTYISPSFISLSLSLSLSFSLSLILNICLPLSLSFSLSVCLPLSLSFSLSVCLPLSLSFSLSVCLPLSLSFLMSVCLPLSLSFLMSVCLPLSLSFSLSVCLPLSLFTILLRLFISISLSQFVWLGFKAHKI